ncbi:hypothetical protein DAEQUDRAFT_237286 [Daedalea quercina L-15889]|uniref:Uncharacterized protein n=1 Tax=Daedalea quercina L-15889 TaxID=1314783 RepID=A0A165QX58_9APHY|nr:hypothetical protein DAEQUDRAFT_237286 [Daedalea quercina L-15889]
MLLLLNFVFIFMLSTAFAAPLPSPFVIWYQSSSISALPTSVSVGPTATASNAVNGKLSVRTPDHSSDYGGETGSWTWDGFGGVADTMDMVAGHQHVVAAADDVPSPSHP